MRNLKRSRGGRSGDSGTSRRPKLVFEFDRWFCLGVLGILLSLWLIGASYAMKGNPFLRGFLFAVGLGLLMVIKSGRVGPQMKRKVSPNDPPGVHGPKE